MCIKKSMSCLILVLIIIFLITQVYAASRLVNFQGRLTDNHGNPLDGEYSIIFSIYESDPNTEALWTEEHTNVSVSNGLVNVLLGSITSFDEPLKITFDEERYLGITIDCDHDPTTSEEEMTPRQRILPALYTYNADKLDGKDSSEYTTPQTDAGRPGVAEHLYEGNTRLVDKYLGKGAKADDSDKLDGYHATTSENESNAIPVINSEVTYGNLRAGYASSASSASSCGNADKLDGYHASSFAFAGHSHSTNSCAWRNAGSGWDFRFTCNSDEFVAGLHLRNLWTGSEWYKHQYVQEVYCCKVR